MTTKLALSNTFETLSSSVPADKWEELRKVLYGPATPACQVAPEAQAAADKAGAEIKCYKVNCPPEQLRPPRLVKVAAIQNSIVLPTTAPLREQYEAIVAKLAALVETAALAGANVICLQEAWTGPFFFCTREKDPWCELAECPKTGPSFHAMAALAKKHRAVIVSPILERDLEHCGVIWNTAVVISHTGNYIGKHRKNHIPRIGDFNEATYYTEGDTGHPVFETVYGKIAVNICYGRHHPLNWHAFGLNGAEIVFNPSATVNGLSESMWAVEARNAAIANSYYTVAINRVGTETFPHAFTSGDGRPAHKEFGHFYGSSYVASPDSAVTPSLSRDKDGVLVVEVDLNLCRQIKDRWMFSTTQRPHLYAEKLAEYCEPDFQPQVISDPVLKKAKL
ncbi:Beta-ureidopropionase [Diplonema papillatum]|nr:Beta-ureidopropionase [Diplonema papillatum]